jgi:hypothetical protein
MERTTRIGAALGAALLCIALKAPAQSVHQAVDAHRLDGGRSAAAIIGTRVRSADGSEVGEIEDLLLSSDAQVVTAVISVGGIFDIADKLVAIPYADVRVGPDEKTLTIPLTTAQLEATPAYEGHSPAVGNAEPLVDPVRAAPPDPAQRREAEAEAARVFAGDDPRVGDGIAENKKAYEDEDPKRAREDTQ